MSEQHRERQVVPEPAQSSATTPAPEAMAVPATASPAESAVPRATAHVPRQPSAPARRATHLRVVAVAGVTVLAAVILAFPRQSSTPGTDNGAAGLQLETPERTADNGQQRGLPAASTASAAVAPRALRATSKKTLVPKAERHRLARSTTSDAPIAALTPAADLPLKEGAPTKLPGSEAIATPASVSAFAGGTTPVTITGCLEVSVDRDDFRLTDTEGADAPRSRSWRTGFLKKRATPVALVEPPDRLTLQTQVGRRVAATGLLTSHDLRVNSLRVVGPACD
jgi:hypothetical protein